MKAIITSAKILILACATMLLILMPRQVCAIPASYESVLENGLRVIMIPDNRVEMAVCYAIIGAGMRHETPDINGATHLLEHMLFNGTKTRTQEQLYAEADRLGAYNNAFTREDFTAFMILSPTRSFKDAVELQADMILNSTLPEAKFEKERGIVLEEINQDASDPYYDVEAAWRRLLWAGTPYEMQVLGPKSVIATIPREKLWNFYKTYYAPNNITLLLIGDFEPKEMLEQIRSLYGSAVPSRMEKSQIVLPKVKGKQIEKRYFGDIEPKLFFAIPLEEDSSRLVGQAYLSSAEAYLVRQAAMPLLEDELKKRFKAMLNREVNFSLAEETHPEGGFIIGKLDLKNADEGEKVFRRLPTILEELKQVQVDSAWLERRKREMLADELKAYDNFLYYGMYRAYDISAGRWDIYKNFEAQVKALSAESVQSFLSDLSRIGEYASMLALPYPEGGAARTRETVEKKKTLENGLTVIVRSDEKSKVFGMALLFKNRLFMEPEGKNGIAELLMRIYSQGPVGMSEEEFAGKLSELGLSIDFYDNPYIPMDDIYLAPHYSYIKAEGLDENWRENLAVIAGILKAPKLTPDALVNAKEELMQVLGMKAGQPREVARKMFFEGFFGGEGLGNNIEGEPNQVQSVTLKELSDFSKVYASANNLILSIATSKPADEVLSAVEELFGGISRSEAIFEWKFNVSEPSDTEKVLGKEQAYIYFGYPQREMAPEDRPALEVLGSILSGRAGMLIREQHGLAYSIGAGFSFIGDFGWFSLAMGTDPKNVEVAKELIRKVLAEAKSEPITEDELKQVVNSMLSRMEMRRITRKNQAFYRALWQHTGENYEDYIGALKRMSPAEVERVREKYFKPEKGVFFVVR